MKTKVNFSILPVISIFMVSFLFTACEDNNDNDTTPPTINLLEPAEGDVLKIGSDIHFELELSDNEMLGSYKVDVHSNFDGHTHSRAIKNEGETIAFSFQKSWDLSDQKNAKIHHHEIVIPENATPGKYHLMVFCTDKAGNESNIARNITLSHEGEKHEH